MESAENKFFTLKDLDQDDDSHWFKDTDSKRAIAGRCLLDAIEYVRSRPKFPGQFLQVANAHALRLTITCLSHSGTDSKVMSAQLEDAVINAASQLRRSRGTQCPKYGEDFWDWASILECFMEVQRLVPNGPISIKFLSEEMEEFEDEVKERIDDGGLKTGQNGEWYGPATAAAAYRIIERWSKLEGTSAKTLLSKLKKAALHMDNGKYFGVTIPQEHVVWHLGQVVALFPKQAKSQWHVVKKSLEVLDDDFSDKAYRAYALARIIQAAVAEKDGKVLLKAVRKVKELEEQNRPFGEGLVAEHIKASLNILEALWPSLTENDKKRIDRMVSALQGAHGRSNTGMIFVAIPNEAKAIRDIFERDGATIVKRDEANFLIQHRHYNIVVTQGKCLIGATKEVSESIERHSPKWVLMIGVAGSLGTQKTERKGKEEQKIFVGPKVGDVVIATSLAPFQIRKKEREQVENAAPPFDGSNWEIVPVNPDLFMIAHRVASMAFPKKENVKVWEGQIVTGTGIVDNHLAKAAILAEFPGGLSVEEEGYPVALICMCKRTPCIVLRGISDLAEGDKINLQKLGQQKEDAQQKKAARNATTIALGIVRRLSKI